MYLTVFQWYLLLPHRLGLERGASARESLDVITSALEAHGQGGPCSNTKDGWCYHNSFIIADGQEAWVLETAGYFWAAEKITGTTFLPLEIRFCELHY